MSLNSQASPPPPPPPLLAASLSRRHARKTAATQRRRFVVVTVRRAIRECRRRRAENHRLTCESVSDRKQELAVVDDRRLRQTPPPPPSPSSSPLPPSPLSVKHALAAFHVNRPIARAARHDNDDAHVKSRLATRRFCFLRERLEHKQRAAMFEQSLRIACRCPSVNNGETPQRVAKLSERLGIGGSSARALRGAMRGAACCKRRLIVVQASARLQSTWRRQRTDRSRIALHIARAIIRSVVGCSTQQRQERIFCLQLFGRSNISRRSSQARVVSCQRAARITPKRCRSARCEQNCLRKRPLAHFDHQKRRLR